MTKMTAFQEKLLQKAYENHTQGKRQIPTWRVCIKAPFNQKPLEISEDVELISGFAKGDWLSFRDINRVMSSIMSTKRILEEYLKSHFPEKINWGYTNTLPVEIFFELGFVFVMSHQFYVRSKAEALMKEWQSQGLDCFLHLEISQGADLKKDDVTGSQQVTDNAFKALEKKGFVIQIKGRHLFWDWEGISLTDAGRKLAEELKDKALESAQEPQPQGEKEVIRPDTMLLKCPECAGVYYRVTEAFDPEVQPIGSMFRLLPKYGPSGENWQALNLNDSGENLVCPNCGGRYVNSENFLEEGVLVKKEDYPDI